LIESLYLDKDAGVDAWAAARRLGRTPRGAFDGSHATRVSMTNAARRLPHTQTQAKTLAQAQAQAKTQAQTQTKIRT